MGSGDPLLILAVGTMNPGIVVVSKLLITPLVASLALSTLHLLGVMINNIVTNIRHWRVFSELTAGMGASRLYYMLLGRVMSSEEFRRSRFYFPLVDVGYQRYVANVEREPLSGSEFEVRGRYVIATKGIPMATSLLVGYITYTILVLALVYKSSTCIIAS